MQPQALQEAGLVAEHLDDGAAGALLRVRDASAPGERSDLRNRGGEALAQLLLADRKIRRLDLVESQIPDSGVAQLSLVLRQTDQLEELRLGRVGHSGLGFVAGVVRRCGRLRALRLEVVDVPTLNRGRQNASAEDFDTSAYEKPKTGDEENEEGAPLNEAERLRLLFTQNDFDSGDEAPGKASGGATGRAAHGAEDGKHATSPALQALLAELLSAVRQRPGLLTVELLGEAVPAEWLHDLNQVVEDHRELHERRQRAKEAKGARSAQEVLKDHIEELHRSTDPGKDAVQGILGRLPGEEPQPTRLGVRAFFNRRLVSVLGQALFECQRFKAAGNEAVATAEGEMAFVAMYLRMYAAGRTAGTDA